MVGKHLQAEAVLGAARKEESFQASSRRKKRSKADLKNLDYGLLGAELCKVTVILAFS